MFQATPGAMGLIATMLQPRCIQSDVSPRVQAMLRKNVCREASVSEDVNRRAIHRIEIGVNQVKQSASIQNGVEIKHCQNMDLLMKRTKTTSAISLCSQTCVVKGLALNGSKQIYYVVCITVYLYTISISVV